MCMKYQRAANLCLNEPTRTGATPNIICSSGVGFRVLDSRGDGVKLLKHHSTPLHGGVQLVPNWLVEVEARKRKQVTRIALCAKTNFDIISTSSWNKVVSIPAHTSEGVCGAINLR